MHLSESFGSGTQSKNHLTDEGQLNTSFIG